VVDGQAKLLGDLAVAEFLNADQAKHFRFVRLDFNDSESQQFLKIRGACLLGWIR
jgi:hypothetical protein